MSVPRKSESLSELIAAHRAAMAVYDACPDEEWDNRSEEIGKALDATRDALLAHRPNTLEEVRTKAEFMASDKAFGDWDDVEPVRLIKALTPATG